MHFNLTGSEPEFLPPEIGTLRNLKSLNLRNIQNLKNLPCEIFNLANDCKIEIEDSALLENPVFLDNLQQTTTHNLNYSGPQFIFTLLFTSQFDSFSSSGLASSSEAQESSASINPSDIDAILAHIFLSAANEEQQSFIDKNTLYLQSSMEEAKSQLLSGQTQAASLFLSNLDLSEISEISNLDEKDPFATSDEEELLSGTTEDESDFISDKHTPFFSFTEDDPTLFSSSNETTDSEEESSFLAVEDE